MMNWIKALRLKHEILEKLDIFEESLSMIDERVEKLDTKISKNRMSEGGQITAMKRDIEALNVAVNSIIDAIEEPSESPQPTFAEEKDLTQEEKNILREKAAIAFNTEDKTWLH